MYPCTRHVLEMRPLSCVVCRSHWPWALYQATTGVRGSDWSCSQSHHKFIQLPFRCNAGRNNQSPVAARKPLRAPAWGPLARGHVEKRVSITRRPDVRVRSERWDPAVGAEPREAERSRHSGRTLAGWRQLDRYLRQAAHAKTPALPLASFKIKGSDCDVTTKRGHFWFLQIAARLFHGWLNNDLNVS